MPMIITYENLLRLSDFKLTTYHKPDNLKIFNFLSFQDAVHYLINAYAWQGKKILMPAFYCDATINDLEKHGLHVHLCQIDHKKFDVNIADFQDKLQSEKPDIVIIYNFFGKNSLLYDNLSWSSYLKPDAFIISDFAHALFPNYKIEPLNDRHFYIDSTRKTTSQMMAHLIMPAKTQFNKKLVVHYSLFKIVIRSLFSLKSLSLRWASLFNVKFFSTIGMQLYILHDKYIGSPECAFTGFWWDSFLFDHINFEKIKRHRRLLYQEYKKKLQYLVSQNHIEVFDLPPKEEENICFFFVRIIQGECIARILKFLQDKGIWAEVLWNFDAIKNISHQDREWAKSVVVLPYTVRTKPRHVRYITSSMESFFQATAGVS